MTKNEWGQLKQELKKTVGSNNFTTWIAPLELDDVAGEVASFAVPTSFFGNYVAQTFGDQILYHLRAIDPSIRRVNFAVPSTASNDPQAPRRAPAPRPKAEAAEPVEAMSDTRIPTAPLDPRFKFDTFVVGKPNELAHAAAKRVAEGGR